MSLKNGKYLNCTKCNKEYYVRANRCDKSKFCSDCWKERNPAEIKQCLQCFKGFLTYERKTKKFCSNECRDKYTSLYKRGELSNGWKDGKSLERERARHTKDLRVWKNGVKERDNYTCQHCRSKDELHAHHIIHWTKDESKRFELSNGLTVCIDCHGKIHDRSFKKISQRFNQWF